MHLSLGGDAKGFDNDRWELRGWSSGKRTSWNDSHDDDGGRREDSLVYDVSTDFSFGESLAGGDSFQA